MSILSEFQALMLGKLEALLKPALAPSGEGALRAVYAENFVGAQMTEELLERFKRKAPAAFLAIPTVRYADSRTAATTQPCRVTATVNSAVLIISTARDDSPGRWDFHYDHEQIIRENLVGLRLSTAESPAGTKADRIVAVSWDAFETAEFSASLFQFYVTLYGTGAPH